MEQLRVQFIEKENGMAQLVSAIYLSTLKYYK